MKQPPANTWMMKRLLFFRFREFCSVGICQSMLRTDQNCPFHQQKVLEALQERDSRRNVLTASL